MAQTTPSEFVTLISGDDRGGCEYLFRTSLEIQYRTEPPIQCP